VLRSLQEQLQGQSVSVILTDPAGLVLSRLTGDGEFDRHLDRVRLAPGFSYAEKFVGTNGIGTALEVGGPAHVFGHEHYAENLENLACAGVPIHHPISGRLVGAVDLTCWRKDAGPLLLTLAKTTAEQIRQALLADAGAAQLGLFQEYLRTCSRRTGAEQRRGHVERPCSCGARAR
jgi:transcriptional regulator of acetoin/glycerol metabolism